MDSAPICITSQSLNASLVISVNRLDRNNKSQTTPILALVSKTMLTAVRPHIVRSSLAQPASEFAQTG